MRRFLHANSLAILAAGALGLGGATAAVAPRLPIRSGQYVFEHRFAEQPQLPSVTLLVTVQGREITLINQTASDVFPKGVIAHGTLMWHAKSREWIIGQDPSDAYAPEVGGCSDGPEIVDLARKIYWTC